MGRTVLNTAAERPYVSKSKFLSGYQCKKLLWNGRVKITPLDTLAVSFSRIGSGLSFEEGETLPTLDGFSPKRVIKRVSQGQQPVGHDSSEQK